mgnify:CR=1 FL=1|jgi:uncharacterized protein YxjI
MKLLIKQHVFRWADTYDVYDEQQQPRYFVKGEVWSLGHVLHVYDAQRRELGVIRQRLLTWMPKFEIFLGGSLVGTLRREWTLFRPRYVLDSHGWAVQGDFFGWDYDVLRQNGRVAHISKELFRWGDTYVLDIADPAAEQACLMIVLAIDAANCGE